MTPEGKIKAQIRKILDQVPDLYYEAYVPSGYGKSGLDFTCCVKGQAFYIEAKDEGETLRPRQRHAAKRMLEAGATVFAVSNADGLQALRDWLVRMGALELPR